MAAQGYVEQCEQIYEKIYRNLHRRDEVQFRFVTAGTAKDVLRGDNLLPLFFQSLFAQRDDECTGEGLTSEEFVSRIEERDLYDFLAILIFAGCSIDAARKFTDRYVRGEAQKLVLPTKRSDLERLFGENADAYKFFSAQAPFCTVVIKKEGEAKFEQPECRRLPYLDEQLLGEGAFGKVFRVTIAPKHFRNREGLLNEHPIELARKDYIVRSGFPPQSERRIMTQILSTEKHGNILKAYSGLDIEAKIYSLFMPLAICDLWDYMSNVSTTAPGTVIEKAKYIRSAQGLAAGLNFLHRDMRTPNMDKLVCYHMDLKPANILVFPPKQAGECYVWKISDFGMARVKVRHPGQRGESDNDFDRWFMPRRNVPDPTATGTRNRRMEGTYLAPESIVANRSMKTESDVWSLGCVLSVVFAYLEEGKLGVVEYQNKRAEHRQADDIDRFFLRAASWSPAKLHPEVKKWHRNLIKKTAQRDPNEGRVLKYVLDYIKNSILQINQPKRATAGEVRDMLEQAAAMYVDLGRRTELPPSLGQDEDAIWRSGAKPKRRSYSDGNVQEMRFHGRAPFTGCTVSSEATLVAYWTDMEMCLYSPESLVPGERQMGSPAGDPYSLAGSNWIWKSVCLTDKYLIASTTGGSFQCYIFDLLGGPSPGASLEKGFRIPLSHSEISKIAICPESNTLACVVRNKDNPNKSSLFLAPIAEMIEAAESIQDPSGNEPPSPVSTRDVSNSSIEDLWPLSNLSWPVSDITNLSFSTCDEIYLVVRPELTVRSSERTGSIVRLNIRDRTEHTLVIVSKGLDVRGHTSLLTTFDLFRTEPASCAVITQQMRLHIHRDVETYRATAITKEIKNYRIHRLMMGWHDDKLFAVGTASGSQKLLLLSVTVPQSDADGISVKVIAQLPNLSYDGEFTARLSADGEEKYVLIASVERGNRHAVYRIKLPGD